MSLDTLEKDIEYIKRDVGEIKDRLSIHYVTQQEFEPIKRIVYGLVGLVLFSFASAVVGLVIVPFIS